MVEIEIDGKKVEVQEGSMVMDAANKLGTYIPHFCYHKKLSIAANCRMCLVEVEKAPKPLPACATPVTAGMIVRSNSDKAVKAQKAVMEFLLINHPLDCPICDQGGECQLQDLAVGYGGVSSRYEEEKRVVFHKDVGPLVSMEEMSRCIHCTRCVRFGQEIAGVMELGMLNRGEHSEITSFVGKTVDSELSGNMIDLCPVGALTSKPFRYSARTWELSRRKSVSAHDGLGSNLIVQVKNNKVMRVVPLENDDVNECWISDKDRFAYEGLNSAERLTKPMIKQGGQWQETDWQTALEYVAHGLRNVKHEHGADAIAAVAAPHATLEELSLLQRVVRGLGSSAVDFRLRQSDFSLNPQVTPWLGTSIAEFAQLKNVFVIGSFLRKDHPLLAARLRASVKMGSKLSILHASDDELLIKLANKAIVAPSQWTAFLAEVAVAVAQKKQVAVPAGFAAITAGAVADKIADSLIAGKAGVFLGTTAAHHPQAAQLHALAEWIASQTEASFGYLGEAANSVGGYLANAAGGTEAAFTAPKKAYLVLHAEPTLDSAYPLQAKAALAQAEMVVVLSPFKHGMDYADVLLPVAPSTETSGTFVNCEGRAQSFHGVVKPLGDTRPAWKVLRVLGNLLGLAEFDFDTSEAVRDAILAQGELSARLNNRAGLAPSVPTAAVAGLERLSNVAIYATDGVVRRAESLQKTADARAPIAAISSALATQLGVVEGDMLKFSKGAAILLNVHIDAGLPDQVVRLAAGLERSANLDGLFGTISVERA
ncbi:MULTISPECIES: NADH-quinone oxidoreductase subunit NuoG [unclassified Undibacterium]|uniref:NADH-quinone oxidoreductase subunit NuoG n=1 Tax=unclassified Undibacterium TaxID=2630295 RepID=UPI002AC8B87A|nr:MULTISPECIES: NADH-quinone oxidoreductase subunit NuoG [unclassified Undibacterium]MEB0139625.1 NADH-quinone oxidoreductase subunit NuoG [Undibacterium sp. CCC2.1]MEB0171981.1 NADH-quinone oxidoreductase subunit NuoG [Undibacterium sp. CCC1.1]MEB0176294.1 NADH-quinone oxidoreductase subunit NuoG [Undibacterium sp. CCC3.4]MEB0213976.1 NADH-quinone oxidoreductase subunit NuoG [Undibacterium sp. 5I2]WPX43592.1 NADH-quinone oxidoreductase subunit NuoG [Undibacterium sp. CCC3.4]